MANLSLLAAAKLAGVSRQTARTCVRRGYVSPPPYEPTAILLFRVGKACLGYLGFETPNARDSLTHTALALANGFILSPLNRRESSMLVLLPDRVALVEDAEALTRALQAAQDGALVLPIGRWVTDIPT